MNRFRNKKKAKDDLSGPRPSIENESSSPFRMFGKKKTQEEEPKADIDFATALPSSDDFRTSLLMNGLSARFSMLREQDDPNSKIGKASDDSVLFPKRQSRLDMFGVGGLQDIAEVESIQAPKFARQGSFNSDDAASTSGSVMNRSKPTEGNNLFGGRQKIYKITGGGNKANGMTGRALYEDDVALSAFQRWRQTEKERSSMEDDRPLKNYEQDLVRSDSPPQNDFSRRRETNSTTSSAPSLARNSTAATSVSSNHPMSMTKDTQSNATSVPGYANNIPERTVTRTRRLYEQGLTQELQDSQSSALSRFDTIAKRPLGVRSPENASSPTSGTFDRRPGVLSKASAPNLRSYTPPTTSSPKLSPAETGSKFASASDQRPSFGSSPPLSPPVSESDEQPTLSIQPNDLGKATAMNVFSRPAQQYDESRYAQRQRQLQQGRETPTSRFRKGSNASVPTSRSRSSSLTRRESSEKLDQGIVQSHSATQAEPPRTTFLDDSDTEPSPAFPADTIAPRVTLERPNDDDHPALRQSALPTPLSVASNDLSPLTGRLPASQSTSRNISPEDSPTLGPQTGLSGMVRAHLRSTSNASSVYGLEEQDTEPHYTRYPSTSFGIDQMAQSGNPWDYADAERRGDDNAQANIVALPPQTQPPTQAPPPIPQSTARPDVAASQNTEDSPENDEFARHLADGARRVRERLTSYADSDTGSHMNTPLADHISDLQPPQRPSTRGSLKSKSSFGSMRNKEPRERSQSRARKMLGIGASTMTSAPSPTRSTTDMDQPTPEPAAAMPQESVDEPRSSSDKDEKDENVHAGLKAFRQARRELQRMKELETRNRRPKQPGPSAPTPTADPTEYEHGPAYHAPSQERSQPPVSYNTRKQSEEYRSTGSRAASRASSERDRSGSEASNGRTHSRPAHLRNGPAPSDDRFRPDSPGMNGGPSGTTRHGAMSRSPAFSPHAASNGLSLQTRGLDTPERSPGLPASPRPGGTTPVGESFPRRPTVQGTASDSLIDTMGSQAIENDPYLATRPRNGSQLNNSSTPNLHSGMAPPLPPINPRRKNNSGGAFRRSDQEDVMAGSPRLPLSPGKGINGRMPSNGYDDAGFPGRKVSMEHSQTSRGRVLQTSPPRSTRNIAQPGTFSSEGGMF